MKRSVFKSAFVSIELCSLGNERSSDVFHVRRLHLGQFGKCSIPFCSKFQGPRAVGAEHMEDDGIGRSFCVLTRQHAALGKDSIMSARLV